MRVSKWVNYFFKYVYIAQLQSSYSGFLSSQAKMNMTQCVIEYLKD